MTRFVVGSDRSQSILFPERLDNLFGRGQSGPGDRMSFSMSLIWPGLVLAASSQSDRNAGLPPGDIVEDFRLRIPQSGAIEPAPS
jgi:hypothetical protein